MQPTGHDPAVRRRASQVSSDGLAAFRPPRPPARRRPRRCRSTGRRLCWSSCQPAAACRAALVKAFELAFIQDPLDLQHGHLAVDLVIEGDDRRQGAATQAGDPIQVVFPVGRRLSGIDAQTLPGGDEDLLSALDMAGRPQADLDVVTARGMEPELGVEGGDAEDLVFRDLEPAGRWPGWRPGGGTRPDPAPSAGPESGRPVRP